MAINRFDRTKVYDCFWFRMNDIGWILAILSLLPPCVGSKMDKQLIFSILGDYLRNYINNSV